MSDVLQARRVVGKQIAKVHFSQHVDRSGDKLRAIDSIILDDGSAIYLSGVEFASDVFACAGYIPPKRKRANREEDRDEASMTMELGEVEGHDAAIRKMAPKLALACKAMYRMLVEVSNQVPPHMWNNSKELVDEVMEDLDKHNA